MAAPTDGATAAPPSSSISLRIPTKYASTTSSTSTASAPPPLDWLRRTWTVTHSTLSMWSKSRNVRITYDALPPHSSGAHRIADIVQHEKLDGSGSLKSIVGVDTSHHSEETGIWNWRGKGWLLWVTSHWEVLGWGERKMGEGASERWAVTWFAPTLFTKEGIDVYSDRREGLSEETSRAVVDALKKIEVKELADMVQQDLKPVAIVLPWKEN